MHARVMIEMFMFYALCYYNIYYVDLAFKLASQMICQTPQTVTTRSVKILEAVQVLYCLQEAHSIQDIEKAKGHQKDARES